VAGVLAAKVANAPHKPLLAQSEPLLQTAPKSTPAGLEVGSFVQWARSSDSKPGLDTRSVAKVQLKRSVCVTVDVLVTVVPVVETDVTVCAAGHVVSDVETVDVDKVGQDPGSVMVVGTVTVERMQLDPDVVEQDADSVIVVGTKMVADTVVSRVTVLHCEIERLVVLNV
jgi:hypothetical protein